jgi:hypothetical protein
VQGCKYATSPATRPASQAPYTNVQFHDPLLSRDPSSHGCVLCIKVFVQEDPAKRERLGDYDCCWWCSGKFERTPGNSGLDAEEKVHSMLDTNRCGVDWCVLRLGFIKLAIREGCVFHHLVHVFHAKVDLCSAGLVPVFSFGENDVRPPPRH